MKKYYALIGFIALTAVSSCAHDETATAALNNNIDSLSYAIGTTHTQGLNAYLSKQFGMDTTQTDEFLKGLKDGFNLHKQDEKAYAIGLGVAQQLNKVIENTNRTLFANDSSKKISIENYMAGFTDVLKGTSKLSHKEVQTCIAQADKKVSVQPSPQKPTRNQARPQTNIKKPKPRQPVRNYYLCKRCRMLIEAPQTPNGSGCSAATFHAWNKICPVGTEHAYSCKRCGIQVETNEMPPGGNFSCLNNQAHYWTKLY